MAFGCFVGFLADTFAFPAFEFVLVRASVRFDGAFGVYGSAGFAGGPVAGQFEAAVTGFVAKDVFDAGFDFSVGAAVVPSLVSLFEVFLGFSCTFSALVVEIEGDGFELVCPGAAVGAFGALAARCRGGAT